MGICSVVITTDEHDSAARHTMKRLVADPRWTLGEGQRGMVAAVLETDTVAEDRRCLRWLDEQPGIVGVHLVFAHYGNEDEGLSLAPPAPPDREPAAAVHSPDRSHAPAEQDGP